MNVGSVNERFFQYDLNSNSVNESFGEMVGIPHQVWGTLNSVLTITKFVMTLPRLPLCFPNSVITYTGLVIDVTCAGLP